PPPAVVAVPPQHGQGQDRSTDQRGTGGAGGGRSGLDGNSAVSNYKGRVYQHLLRYRQTNTIGSGKVLVAFIVEPDGSARNISVTRSSGSSRFDREAVQLVRRAVPLPSPPDGVSHSFTFEISGQ
ncbi:energy transducer TonB, partial [Novosphingobium sp. AP12]|uniref:energy transducer TonB family protein n=1 Tax=Novosphingobium sp. AP12 TaxID=1144305 RepID=UPI000271FAFB